MDETMLTSLSNPPATPPLKGQKYHQPSSSSKQPTNDGNGLSTPKVRQSGKILLTFRAQTPTNVNPIVAFANDPSVQLTSYRKVDEESTPTVFATALDNHASPAAALFPYQSDSDIINSSTSTRLSKQASRHSLPDVPYSRSHGAAVPMMDSPIIPEFLCGTPDRSDDVFSANEQEKVVAASTFGDSSMKSKVLQASFRGKASTMDRRTAAATTPLRSQSTSSSSADANATAKHTTYKRQPQTQPRYFVTKTNDNANNQSGNGPVNCSLDSVLNLTLQLEQSATADYQRRHTLSPDDVDPVLLNGFTNEENALHRSEKTNGHHSPLASDNHQLSVIEERQEGASEHERIRNHATRNSPSME